MTKTETEIAKEYKNNLMKSTTKNQKLIWLTITTKHKEHCERELEFLENIKFISNNNDYECIMIEIIVDMKINDLKKAIKIHEGKDE